MRSLEDDSLYCETRIFNACRTGNLRSLKMLLRECEALANRTYHSVTSGHPEHLLAVAIKEGHTELVRCLEELIAKRGVNINVTDNDGVTPLMIAARWGKFERLTCLLKAEADINASMDDGTTSLHLAAAYGHTENVKAFDGIWLNEKQNSSKTPLDLAHKSGCRECVKLLNEKGAKSSWACLIQ